MIDISDIIFYNFLKKRNNDVIRGLKKPVQSQEIYSSTEIKLIYLTFIHYKENISILNIIFMKMILKLRK